MHKLLRYIAKYLALCLTLAIPAPCPAQAAPPTELVWLTWSDYTDPTLISEFEQRYHAKVRQVYFDADDMRNEMLLARDGAGYDVACINGPSLTLYNKRGWLAPLTAAEVPNLKHIDPRWLNAFSVAEGYAVPYLWGTIGIAYRKDLVPEPITTWRQFFHPSEALRGRVLALKEMRETLGMALKSLGYSSYSTNPEELAEAEQLLLAQKPFVKSYSYVPLTEESPLVTGEVWVTMAFSGDGITLHGLNPNIVYVLPEEGSNTWVDYLAVLKSSKHKSLAMRFIDFLNEPRNAARLAQYLNYPTPNRSAEKLLPTSFLNNPIIYPPRKTLEKSEFHRELPPDGLKRRISLFNRVVN